jgi:hypothetical protein
LAARTHTYVRSSSGGRGSKFRGGLAVLCGLAAVIAIPAAIEFTRRTAGETTLDAAWAIPVAAVASLASFVLERSARGLLGSRRLVAARVFAVTGVCLTLSSALAVGIYEFLVWKENH